MDYPDWADEQLSRDLAVLRARGENQDLEYIESFPQNVRELGKEIAAFATSNSGTILVGVADNGDLVGISDAVTVEERDQLLRRVEGICTGTIKPAVTPVARFAVESGAVVLVLLVPKGSQPVYYSHNIPYIRHITQSRPAEPHEVVDLIRNHLFPSAGGTDENRPDPRSEFYSQLANILIRILIYADETGEREVNPWLELWRAEFRSAATELRDLGIHDVAKEDNFKQNLDELSEALDKVATFRLHLGYGPELDKLTQHVADLARKLKETSIDTIPLSSASLEQIKSVVRQSSRKLKALVSRASELTDSGRIDELQDEASRIGRQLLQLSYYNLDSLGVNFTQQLQSVARDLHLVETMRLYMDGGRSVQAVADRVSKGSEALDAHASRMAE